MSDKVVLITGAARRIGAEIARTLHSLGYRVVLHYHHSAAEAQQLAAELNASRPDSAHLYTLDLAATDQLADLVASAIGLWGRLDGLVNNASAFYPTPLDTVSEAQWEHLMASNLKAPFFLAQAAAVPLREQGGAIVNIADVYAERPLRGYPVYSIAKAGLVALTKSLAVELAPDIRVNAVAPGAILWPEQDTNDAKQAEILAKIPLSRRGAPGDIAQAVAFLLAAPYVTGQVIAVDGGRGLFI